MGRGTGIFIFQVDLVFICALSVNRPFSWTRGGWISRS